MSNPKIVFFGTPEFSVKILEHMERAGLMPVLIVTAPDKPKGRKLRLMPPSVKIWAQKHGIEFTQPEALKNNPSFYALLFSISPDLIVLAAYGKIIPKEILEIPEYGAINVHPSLLPKLRGPSPIQSAILNGDKITGVTIMLMNEKMDEGPTLAAQELGISKLKIQSSNLTYKELESELTELGGKLLIETIPEWLEGKIKPMPQNHSKATYTEIIKKEDGLIDFNKEPPEVIERKIRAFTPWPSAYAFIGGKRLIITEAKLSGNNALKIKRVKPESKKEVDFKDFLKSNPNASLEKYL